MQNNAMPQSRTEELENALRFCRMYLNAITTTSDPVTIDNIATYLMTFIDEVLEVR
jgi:hypothetical protein